MRIDLKEREREKIYNRDLGGCWKRIKCQTTVKDSLSELSDLLAKETEESCHIFVMDVITCCQRRRPTAVESRRSFPTREMNIAQGRTFVILVATVYYRL